MPSLSSGVKPSQPLALPSHSNASYSRESRVRFRSSLSNVTSVVKSLPRVPDRGPALIRVIVAVQLLPQGSEGPIGDAGEPVGPRIEGKGKDLRF